MRKSQYINTFHNNSEFRYASVYLDRSTINLLMETPSRVLLMDLTQAAFGLDMRGASRIYFISPVLNPQVEAQAIGRVRRISQQKPVSVETLVLRGSIDEVLLERKQHMSQAEHRKVKSVLDIQSIYNWIKLASMVPLTDVNGNPINESPESQMAPLKIPQQVFGRGFGRAIHPDEGILLDEPQVKASGSSTPKRTHSNINGSSTGPMKTVTGASPLGEIPHMPKRIKFNM